MYDEPFYTESIDAMTLADTDWIIPGLVPTEGITVIDGKPKSGKSTFALGIAMSVAQGTLFANDERFTGGLHGQPTPCLWIGTDGRWKHELNKRRLFYPDENRGNLETLDGRKHGLIFPAGHGEDLGKSLARWSQLTRLAVEQGFRVIILDHLLKIAGSRSINNDSDMSPVIGVLDELVLAGIVPVLLHHQSVHANSGKSMGHTVIHASMRSGLSLKDRAKQQDVQKITVTTNENAEMLLTIRPLRGRPPEVVDFKEATKDVDQAKRERQPKDDIDIRRAKAIINNPDPSVRANQATAGRYLKSLGTEVMGGATDGRQVVKKLIQSGLIQAEPDRSLTAGPRWTA